MFFAMIVAAFAIMIVAAIAGIASLVFGLILLPFRLLGLVFRGLAALLFLPLLLLIGAAIAFPLLLVLMIPLLPLVLFVGLVVWLARRGLRHASPSH